MARLILSVMTAVLLSTVGLFAAGSQVAAAATVSPTAATVSAGAVVSSHPTTAIPEASGCHWGLVNGSESYAYCTSGTYYAWAHCETDPFGNWVAVYGATQSNGNLSLAQCNFGEGITTYGYVPVS